MPYQRQPGEEAGILSDMGLQSWFDHSRPQPPIRFRVPVDEDSLRRVIEPKIAVVVQVRGSKEAFWLERVELLHYRHDTIASSAVWGSVDEGETRRHEWPYK